MAKFTLHLSEKVPNTIIKLYKLVANDVCAIDEFESQILKDGTYSKEIDSLYATIEQTCNRLKVPKQNWKMLQMGKSPYKVYEARSRNLRMYLIHEEKTGRIIICGGKKSDQDKDIKRIKGLVKEIDQNKLIITKKA